MSTEMYAEMYPTTDHGIYMESDIATPDEVYAEMRAWAIDEGWTYATVEGGHAELWDGNERQYMVVYTGA